MRFLGDSWEIPVRLTNNIHALEWVAFTVSAGSWWCVVDHQVWLLRLFLKLDMFGRDEGGIGQCQPAPAPQSNAPSKGRQLLVNAVVVLEFLLQLLDIVNLHNQAQAFAGEQEEGIDQGLGGFAADVGFLPFAVLFHILIRQTLDLFVCELHTDGFFGLAGRHKDGQLLPLGRDVVGRCAEINYPCGLGGVRRGLQKLHDFVQSFLLLCGGHEYIWVLDFNDSLYIGTRSHRGTAVRIPGGRTCAP